MIMGCCVAAAMAGCLEVATEEKPLVLRGFPSQPCLGNHSYGHGYQL